MRFTLSWLGEHLEFAAGSRQPEFIARRLTELGLDVEHLERPAAGLENFVVGRIVAVEKHPRADRLHVCRVDTGREIAQVVCGAPNVAAGRAGVFAAPGCDIPGTGLHLKPAEIRGVESRGMLLSERELGVSDDHDGIVLFDEPAPAAGTPYLKASGRDDVIFDVAVTPNRGDWYSVRGIARELAAGGCGRLRPLPDYIPPVGHESPLRWRRAMTKTTPRLFPRCADGICGLTRTARLPRGCGGVLRRRDRNQSQRSWISPTISPLTSAVRCMCLTRRRWTATLFCAARAPARNLSRLTRRNTRLRPTTS